ncbi:low molecular weight protein-tyrosine-phosphatase [Streptomyces sp. VRA16 Mangrove soil]|uniref:low molecular weight protein-tyrosine-phosphatase n=1 Tax=Streptomyces sp. VRA16 Mangrove soil TaxID=2817434 RepID=UPI001A9EB354|nr:low molecular weight protein-tyrosine-phosphatase [Streptomyces sp. VRA16 Mangrove soil]MBO1336754.1 low molecular weight phosphotyrosine protein phosphatase [Streptomyces sp. VRA16 Mangrove soil]
MTAPFRVCFVCTGNICRSPMAEHVFRSYVEEAGLDGLVEVDSAGTDGWHEGDGADPRTVRVLEEGGYTGEHTARQFRRDWFDRLDLVIALDAGHLRTLRRIAPTPQDAEKVRLLRSYDPAADPDDMDVPDPYYGDMDGFEECLKMVEAAGDGLLDAVREAVEGRAA